jgi:hypothetical protein
VPDFLKTVTKEGEHGVGFQYKGVDTEVIGWVLQRVCGKSSAELVSESAACLWPARDSTAACMSARHRACITFVFKWFPALALIAASLIRCCRTGRHGAALRSAFRSRPRSRRRRKLGRNCNGNRSGPVCARCRRGLQI